MMSMTLPVILAMLGLCSMIILVTYVTCVGLTRVATESHPSHSGASVPSPCPQLRALQPSGLDGKHGNTMTRPDELELTQQYVHVCLPDGTSLLGTASLVDIASIDSGASSPAATRQHTV